MEHGLNPTHSRRPISRRRKTLAIWLIALGLTTILAPIGILLLVTAFPTQLSGQQTLWGLARLSIYSLYTYGTVGVVMLVMGLWLRHADAWLIGLGLTLIVVPLVLLYKASPHFLLTHLTGVWSDPLVKYFGSYGVVTVMIGLWMRHSPRRQISG